MKREPGYYWVKLGVDWVVGRWNDRFLDWSLPGSHMEFSDKELDGINETRLIAPDEQQETK